MINETSNLQITPSELHHHEQKHFDKIVVMVDMTPQHQANNIKEMLKRYKNIKIIYLPKRSTYLNAAE